MPFLAFVVTSGFGAVALVWDISHDRPRRAAAAVLAAATASILYWLLAVPRFAGTGTALFGAVATLLLAILLPGGAGAAVAYASKTRGGRVGGFLLMLTLWLPLVFVGMFSVCQLDPRCDL